MNRNWNWTEQLKAKICDERGISLIEVLAVITIMAVVTSVLSSTLVTGQKIYIKQTAETQFREDADYVTTRIMNEFYSTPFDEVDTCKDTGFGTAPDTSCVKIIDSMETSFNKVKNSNEESGSPEYHYDPTQTTKHSILETKISVVDEQVQIQKSKVEDNKESVIVSTEILEAPSSFKANPLTTNNSEGSSRKPIFQVVCTSRTDTSSCQSGTIELSFHLGSDKTTEKLQLESRFGF